MKILLYGNKPPDAAVAKHLHQDWLERSKKDLPLVIVAEDKEDAVRQLMQFVGGARELRNLILRITKQTKRKRGRPGNRSRDNLFLATTDGCNKQFRQLADRFYSKDAVKQKKAMVKRLQRLRDKLDTK